MLYLVRSRADEAGFCECKPGLMNAPYTNVSPEGGTGYMFTCLRCRQGFDVAVAKEISETLDELAREGVPRVSRVMDGQTGKITETVLLRGPDDWKAAVLPLLDGLVKDRNYVYFDGKILPYERGPVRFKGLTREHDLPNLPHLDVRLSEVLTDVDYWYGAPLEQVLNGSSGADVDDGGEERGASTSRPWWKFW